MDFNANPTLERTARGIKKVEQNDTNSENVEKHKKKNNVETKSGSSNKKQKIRQKRNKLNLKKKKSQKKTKIIKFEKNQEREKNQIKSPGSDTEKIKKKNLQKSFSNRQAILDSCIEVRFE